MSKFYASISRECVACGSCLTVCPREAISIFHGKYAVVDEKKCIGCKKCQKQCPADVIKMSIRESFL